MRNATIFFIVFCVGSIFYFLHVHPWVQSPTTHIIFNNIQSSSGIDFHSNPIIKMAPMHYGHGAGIAAADINNDSLIDIYLLNQLGSPKLYQNLGKGKFKDITQQSHTGITDRVSIGAAFGDYDNDGDQDLFVTTIRKGTILFENNGKGIFTDVTNHAGVSYKGHPSTALWFDYNNDGYLDLFVVNVGAFTQPNEKEAEKQGYYEPISDAFLQQLKVPGEPPILYKNNGDKTFTNVSNIFKDTITDWVGAATIIDINNDGFLDLYITSMAGSDHLFINHQGNYFSDETPTYFPKTSWGSMGAKFFDYNNDGLYDLYVTDMHSDMIFSDQNQYPGNKLQWESLQKEKRKHLKTVLGDVNTDRFIFGNSFYENKGNNIYKEISDTNGTETFWPWGISTGDINADGYEDIFLASGMGNMDPYQENLLLINENGKRFVQKQQEYGIEPRQNGSTEQNFMTSKAGTVMSGTRSSRSAVIFDFDNDGDLDIVTNEFNDYPLVLENSLAQIKPLSFLKVSLVGKQSNTNAVGSKIMLEDNHGEKQYRLVDGNSGYFGFSQLPIYFGLKKNHLPKKITIWWPSGIKQTKDIHILNNIITIIENK